MVAGDASRTAEYVALFRALESLRGPSRLFADPLAAGFLRPSLRALVALCRLPTVHAAVTGYLDRRWPGARSSAVGRTRLIDEVVQAALRDGVDQVLLLGAGFDARAYRLPGLAQARVFEVDHPDTQARKRRLLERTLGGIPPHVAFVPVDFDRETPEAPLRAAGFVPERATVAVWEGVTNYLTAEAVDGTLRWLGRALAPGSRLAFTYVHRGVLDGTTAFPGAEAARTAVTRAGEPWTFGLLPAELPGYLGDRGLVLLEDVGADEYRARWLGADTSGLRGYGFYRVAVARPGALSHAARR